LDFVVEGAIYVELKAIHEIPDVQYAIVRSGLKAADLQHALLLNFATMPLTIKRVGREDPARRSSRRRLPAPEFVIS
jgi:GxxExxY protein